MMLNAIGNSAALTILRSGSASADPKTAGNAAALQIVGSMLGQPGFDPIRNAAEEISRIVLEGGGQFIVGGAFSTIEGTDKDDIIYGGPGSVVNGGAGNDFIRTDVESVANGGDGDDWIEVASNSIANGDAGDDTVIGYNAILNGGDGNDHVSGSDNIAHGGDGDDRLGALTGSVLYGDAGNDRIDIFGKNIVSGGTGDDYITIEGDDVSGAVVLYGAGDGKDMLDLGSAGVGVTLKLGEGLTAENMRVSVQEDIATITFDGNEDDRITVKFGIGSLAIAFGDGSTTAIEAKPVSDATRMMRAKAFLAYLEH